MSLSVATSAIDDGGAVASIRVPVIALHSTEAGITPVREERFPDVSSASRLVSAAAMLGFQQAWRENSDLFALIRRSWGKAAVQEGTYS